MVSPVQWKKIKEDGLNLDYAGHFIDKKEADKLFQRLESEIEYFNGDLTKVKVFGKWHEIPRQQVAFGDPGLKYKFSGTSVPALSWPDVLMELREKLEKAVGHRYNFVLINRYRNGKDHMGEHRDDEKELEQDCGIASISLGEVRQFVLRHWSVRQKKQKGAIEGPRPPTVRLQLGHGSLLLMWPPTNTYWYHSLPKAASRKGVRINLTFRKIKP